MEWPSPCASAHAARTKGRHNPTGQFLMAAQGNLMCFGCILKPAAEVFLLWVQCLMPSRCRRSGALPGPVPCSQLCFARYICLVSLRELHYVGFRSLKNLKSGYWKLVQRYPVAEYKPVARNSGRRKLEGKELQWFLLVQSS